MKIQNKLIETLHYSDLTDIESCYISNSIIKTIDFISFDPNVSIIISNSIIYEFLIHACWFKKGLIFTNNHVINYIDYQMGGHNEDPIKMTGNIFHEFFNFFDCYFTHTLFLKSNIFLKGTNLLGNKNEAYKNSFNDQLKISNNIGLLDVDGLGR